jgi:hypothetical protein
MSTLEQASAAEVKAAAARARDQLDAHTYEIIQWHFHPSTGCPFWLEKAKELKFDPLKEVKTFDDLKKFDAFQDEWLRGGPVRRWVPKAFADKPIYVFETGGTTGVPKSRIAIEDFRTDYSLFSKTLPDEYFPPGANWLMLGPSGPRRLACSPLPSCLNRWQRSWRSAARQSRSRGSRASFQAAPSSRPSGHALPPRSFSKVST